MHSYSLVVVHHLVFHSVPTLLSPPHCDDSSFWTSFYPLISLLSLSCAFSSYAWTISTKKNKKLQQALKETLYFQPLHHDPSTNLSTLDSLCAAFWTTERSFLLLQKPEAELPFLKPQLPFCVESQQTLAPHSDDNALTQSSLGSAEGQISSTVWKLSFKTATWPLAQGTTKPLTMKCLELLKGITTHCCLFAGGHYTEQDAVGNSCVFLFKEYDTQGEYG